MQVRVSRARRLTVVAVAAVAMSGCGSSDPTGSGAEPAQSSSASTAPEPPKVKINPAQGASDVLPDTPVTVQALRGDLSEVSVTSADGHEVAGDVEGHTWTATSRLKPATEYTVTVAAVGPDAETTSTVTSSFTTHQPAVTATYGIVYNGQTVGVGMPVSIQFDSAVTDEKYRQSIEEAVSVTTSPQTEGAWGWLDNRQLMWRPKEFWAPGTSVTINAPLTGFQTGEDKWVAEDASGSMTIGRRQLSTVDIADHRMTVNRDGQTIKTYPVSSGRPGKETETRSGMKVVIGKQREMTMDASTLGIDKDDEDYYKVETDYNVRVTWTGEFIHSAPWSVNAQGHTNVSHGCVNMAPENARWFFENSLPGDPVNFTGSSREFLPTEGIGVWQYSWEQWQQQSALA